MNELVSWMHLTMILVYKFHIRYSFSRNVERQFHHGIQSSSVGGGKECFSHGKYISLAASYLIYTSIFFIADNSN